MAHIVFTSIDNIAEIADAKWQPGDNKSYANTKSNAMTLQCSIKLVGRQDKYGRVQLCYAAMNGRPWVAVGDSCLVLARFFMAKLDKCPAGDTLRVFFNEIDDPVAAHEAQQLIALECGINVTKEPWGKLHLAVLSVQERLNALGVPCGDWTFVPMVNSFQPMALAV